MSSTLLKTKFHLFGLFLRYFNRRVDKFFYWGNKSAKTFLSIVLRINLWAFLVSAYRVEILLFPSQILALWRKHIGIETFLLAFQSDVLIFGRELEFNIDFFRWFDLNNLWIFPCLSEICIAQLLQKGQSKFAFFILFNLASDLVFGKFLTQFL